MPSSSSRLLATGFPEDRFTAFSTGNVSPWPTKRRERTSWPRCRVGDVLPMPNELSEREGADESMIWPCCVGVQETTIGNKCVVEDERATTTRAICLGRHIHEWVESKHSLGILGDQADFCFAGDPLRHGRSDRGIARGEAVSECFQDAGVSERVYATTRRGALRIPWPNGRRSTTRVRRAPPPVWPQAARAGRLQPGLRNVAHRA